MSVLFDANGLALPSTGLRQDLALEVKVNMRQYLVDTVFDRVAHAEAIAAGPFVFRDIFMKCLGAYFGNSRGNCDHLANITFDILKRIWRDKYPQQSPQSFLDTVHIASPLSEKQMEQEIDDAWEVEIAGSEEGLRAHYDGSARVRKGKDLGAKRPH